MVRMMIYGGSEGANAILQISPGLTPNNRCICKKTALQHHSQEKPLRPFDQNRLVPVKKNNMTYGVIKEHHIVYRYENGTVAKEEWLQTGDVLTPPSHPSKEGYTPNGWNPSLPSTATSDGDYTMQYSVNQYIITFIGFNGTILSSDSYNYGQAITAPDPQTPPGWEFDGWDSPIPSVATASGTYTAQYHENSPVPYDPGQDLPTDGDGHYGRDGVVYTMDNMGLAFDPVYTKRDTLKPAPTSNIKNGVYTGRIAQLLNVPEGTSWVPVYNGQRTWYSGPMDGFGEDKYGEDEGISAGQSESGRLPIIEGYTWYDSDSCVYEYAQVDKSSLPRDKDDLHWIDFVSSFTCPCYRNGEKIGDFTITCDDPWIKIAIGQWNEDPHMYDDFTCPFYVHYFVEQNDSSTPRVGTVTVTTPGGTCTHNATGSNPDKNKPYTTSGHVFFYQLGKD